MSPSNKKDTFAHPIGMILGEMALLTAAVFVMIGAAKGITSRLRINDYVATFSVFVIVLLNARGGIKLTDAYSLSLGGVLSVLLGIYTLISRSERVSDALFALFSALGAAGIAFAYTLHFSEEVPIDPQLLAVLLALLLGLWCAFSSRRTFSACLFSALTGGFLGVTLYQTIVVKGGNIGGNYSFAVMWLGALFGLLMQYLLTVMLRAVKSPRANSYFEAGELVDEKEKEKKPEG